MANLSAAYLMESDDEGQRLRVKTDLVYARENLRQAGLQKGMTCLDVGCGVGVLTGVMHELSDGAPTVGLDMSAARINEANERGRRAGVSIRFICARADCVPVEGEAFDFVWSRFLFEYLVDPDRVLNEMIRVAKRGGIVAVADLDAQLTGFYPQSKAVATGMARALRLLEDRGFDPNVGRKLYAMFKRGGLTGIKVAVIPYQSYVGGLPPSARENWKSKMVAATRRMTELEPSTNWDEFAQGVLQEMSRPDSFYYSTMILVRGNKQ